jgi:ferredoxin
VAYVVTEQCINCKHTDCVAVCPADAFHEGPNFVVINPDSCIDCDLCVPACPVGAIYAPENVPLEQSSFVLINASLSSEWPLITEQKDSLPEADSWRDADNKRRLLVA